MNINSWNTITDSLNIGGISLNIDVTYINLNVLFLENGYTYSNHIVKHSFNVHCYNLLLILTQICLHAVVPLCSEANNSYLIPYVVFKKAWIKKGFFRCWLILLLLKATRTYIDPYCWGITFKEGRDHWHTDASWTAFSSPWLYLHRCISLILSNFPREFLEEKTH